MRLFLDECLSPRIARDLNVEGRHVAVHPRDFGGVGAPDHSVLKRCIKQDLVIVTADARDFRSLVATQSLHPGLIILPNIDRERTEELLRTAIDFLSELGNPMDVMVNQALEVSDTASMELSPLFRE